jgi:gliding motility-associated-like protein
MLCVVNGSNASGQTLLNGNLEGATVTAFSILPAQWLAVPYYDSACWAINDPTASPDLTDTFGPSASGGVIGYAHSAPTFVSGLLLAAGPSVYHEGIMQEISSLDTECTYVLSFYQSVVNQINALDTTGACAIYADDSLIAISDISKSKLAYDDPNLQWDYREIVFRPWARKHNIKFLPIDDDANIVNSATDQGAALRMGIDDIAMFAQRSRYPLSFLGEEQTVCADQKVVLKLPFADGGNVLWSNGSTAHSVLVTSDSTYYVAAQKACVDYIDTVVVHFEYCPCTVFVPNAFTPNNDFLNDEIHVKIDCVFSNYEFRVYDRWGTNIFASDNAASSWDGYFKGILLPQGTYFFTLRFQYIEGYKNIFGDIVLLR